MFSKPSFLLTVLSVAILIMTGCSTGPAQTPTAPAQLTITAQVSPALLKPAHMVIIGDSTVCNWPAGDNLHREGWGMHVQERFKEPMTVSNLALSGRSTKTFITEGRWARALQEKPDFVLIQFGHNDSHAPTNPESTNAATDFRDNLRKYIDDTRAIGGVPILITPMCRRSTPDTLIPYAEAMKAVAAEKHVALIDLHASSAKLYAQLGPEGVHSLEANLANGQYDPTHFNAVGAQAMAKLVFDELPATTPQLVPYLK
jgi:lysophospholipase L1-like esterase